jgi:hypothetical protein
MSVNLNQHRHIDLNISAAITIPSAGASNYTAGIDTRAAGTAVLVAGAQTVAMAGNAALMEMAAMVRVDATTTLVDSKALTIKIQDSDDNSSFADVASLAGQTVTGLTGNGSVETDLRWAIPQAVRRYIRAYCTCPSDAGTNTGFSYTLYLVS